MKKTLIAVSIFIIVGILGFIGYVFLSSSGVSQEFIDKHNEIASLEKETYQLADLTGMSEIENLDKQIEKEDYKEALKSVETALGRKKEAVSKLNSIKDKLAELEVVSSKISNTKMKANAEKFIDIAKKENTAKIDYSNLQIKMLEDFKTMVEILTKNPNDINAADEKVVNDLGKEIDSIENQINNAEKEVDNIQKQYEAAEKEFFELAGLEASN